MKLWWLEILILYLIVKGIAAKKRLI